MNMTPDQTTKVQTLWARYKQEIRAAKMGKMSYTIPFDTKREIDSILDDARIDAILADRNASR